MQRRYSLIQTILQWGIGCFLLGITATPVAAQEGVFNQKLSPDAAVVVKKKHTAKETFILTAINTDSLLVYLHKLKPAVQIIAIDKPSNSILVAASPEFIRTTITKYPGILFIDLKKEAHTETGIIGLNRSFHGISALDYLIPGANGKNITAGVKEQKMEEADLDLHKRVLSSGIASGTTSIHATVISSIIGGSGNSFYDGRGIANACKFFSSSFANLFPDDVATLINNRVFVQNHSYGTIIQPFYGAEAVSYDVQTWNNKNIVHVFSAGNQGTAASGSGTYANIPGFANLTGNFKMAKNIITVGAIDKEGVIPAESSAGPLHDGRLAPQLVALGPNGTSDAAAMVTGTVAVLQQVFADSNGQQLPPASLMKAVLFNTADDIHRTGIDYKTGYGNLNTFEAVKAIQHKRYDGSNISQGQQWIKNITIPANAAQVKITLAWTDSAGLVNNSKALINDLDLELLHPASGTVYKPWVLSAATNIDSLNKAPTRKRDSLNTAEQISIQLPVAGSYQIKVAGSTVNSPIVPFHIAFNTDTLNTFHFTFPNHAADINRDEQPVAAIRWRTFVADTNTTGNLFISYNSGANWQLLKAGHKIYTNQYNWVVKDTASTALFKMETAFGDFFSRPFILSKTIRPQLDFLCADSLRLSWNRHVYATSYKIHMLTDSPYLKPFLTITDTAVVLNRIQYPSLVYAVEPVLSNGLPAARSIAQDITLQGVNCFYKALNYVLLDSNNIRLSLELSTTYSIDSISFEKVTAQGGLIQRYGNRRILAGQLLYEQLILSLPPGLNYFRARIKLVNGTVIYTEIISILSSGENSIWIYPNPARSGATLSYMLRNQADYFQLQLTDINGRIIKQWEVAFAGSIRLPLLPAGIYMLRLTDKNNNAAGSSKLVIY